MYYTHLAVFLFLSLDLDLSVSRLKQEHGEVAMKEKEMNRLTQANHQLQDEIVSLKNMMADYSLCKRELDGYKREVQEKVSQPAMLQDLIHD